MNYSQRERRRKRWKTAQQLSTFGVELLSTVLYLHFFSPNVFYSVIPFEFCFSGTELRSDASDVFFIFPTIIFPDVHIGLFIFYCVNSVGIFNSETETSTENNPHTISSSYNQFSVSHNLLTFHYIA